MFLGKYAYVFVVIKTYDVMFITLYSFPDISLCSIGMKNNNLLIFKNRQVNYHILVITKRVELKILTFIIIFDINTMYSLCWVNEDVLKGIVVFRTFKSIL